MVLRPSVLVFLLPVLMVVSTCCRAQAADWSVVPQVKMGGEFDSNLNFAFGSKESDYILNLSPAADFNYTTEISQLTGRLALKGLHYLKNSNLDKINQNYQISGRFLAGPRLNLTFTGSYILDSTLQEELTESGFIMNRSPRQSSRLIPGLGYQLTERAVLKMDYTFYNVHYQDPRFTNYFEHKATLGLTYLLKNEKSTLQGMLVGRMTRYPDIGNSRRALGTYGGVEHKFAEDWKAFLLGGLNYSWMKTQTAALDFSDFPFFILVRQKEEKTFGVRPFFDLSTTRRWTITSFTVGYRRDESASGGGTFLEYNRVYMDLDYDYSEKLKGSLRGELYYSEKDTQGSDYRNLTLTIAPQATYRITEKLSLTSGYKLGWREDRVQHRSTNRHLVWLYLNYSYPVHYQK